MKLQVVSDLHLEFQPIEPVNTGADILVLAGDICTIFGFTRKKESSKYYLHERFFEFFQKCHKNFEHILYVPGNHEFYQGNLDTSVDDLRRELNGWNNIHVLDDDLIEIGDTTFYGATLWTDFNRGDPIAKIIVKDALNDYKYIATAKHYKMRPEDTLAKHQNTLYNLSALCQLDKKVVFIGHHAPSYRSIEERYRSTGMINYGYYSDLENFILDHSQIKLWVHGHVHSSHDYLIGQTRVVANPRGYATPSGMPENVNFNFGKIYEL